MNKLTCISVHSLRGGVGKSTKALRIAKEAALTQPTLLVELDLVSSRYAESVWALLPDGGRQEIGNPRGPYVNDFLLARRDRFDPEQDVRLQDIWWQVLEADGTLYLCPSSPWPAAVQAVLPVIYDELNTGFIESRLEWLLEQVLKHTDVRTVVFDAPTGLTGLSACLLSMAARLPDHVHLAPTHPEQSPPLLMGADVTWEARVILTEGLGESRSLERWLAGKPANERARIRPVLSQIGAKP